MKNIKLVKAKFEMEHEIEMFPNFAGYFDPSNRYWNGYANPYFELANRNAWIAFAKVAYEDMPEIVEELESIQPEWVDGKYLYYFGGGFTWHEVDAEEC